MSECERAGKWIGGCRFEARYELSAPGLKIESYEGPRLVDVIEASRAKTYVHDICTRCGKVVQRPTPTNPNSRSE